MRWEGAGGAREWRDKVKRGKERDECFELSSEDELAHTLGPLTPPVLCA